MYTSIFGQNRAGYTCRFLSISMASILMSMAAQAITPEQYQEQRSEALKQQQLVNPNVTIDTNVFKPAPSSSITPSASQSADPDSLPCFEINHIYMTGELSEQFSFALTPYTMGKSSLLGSCLSVNDINRLVTNVQNRIIEKGYVTTRVLVQNQNLKSGNLFLTLIPGRIDQITAVDIKASRPIYVDSRLNSGGNPANFAPAMPMSSGDLLNVRDIEQALENFKRVPTADADFSIAPSSRMSTLGYSDIQVKWQQDKRWRLSASVDDSGQESTGVYQGNVTLSLDNPTWHNDLLYLSYNHDLDGGNDKNDGSWGYNVGYVLPIDNTQLTLTHSGYNYDQTVAGANQDYVYSGESYNTEALVSHLVHRDNHSKTYLKAGGYAKQQNNFIDDTEIEVQRRRTAGYKAGIGYETIIGKTQWIGDVIYQRGTAAFNAISPPEALFNEGSARAGIIKTNIDVNQPIKLADKALNYHAAFKGQYATEALTPNERFSIGGRYSVRGFDGERSLSGDHGALLRQELSAYIGDKPHAVYAGIDAGYVKLDNAAQDDLLLGNHLVGGVVGFKGYVTPIRTSYDLFAGYPLAQPDNFSDKEWVTGFSLGWQY
ncbi:ShlB/FhaC/HecB family hemolysin secretion/activation protein [Psychrobacter sp. ANT_WB68]|uniref:ShlB/FhaC/HecB family hemolysin secretion/activation protein n=1 Tax=Psychrobacter sp. ANT_WB68 TaxID=2597355 RepID=UPI0011F1455D|nr:ShlB/FhaC/HecB family hemolysin secretion/activation protein [Psychrobacter sp. ANT_WB68]KAA0915569.1 ShlB/FhaC/HecB family hemolysin secretion/activation protein [Psychrobacter sp. ANT_WB68]